MNKKLITAVLAMVSLTGISQQMPQYSQYLRNQFMVNPAAAGVYDFTDITVSGRWQWIGFDNTPKTAYASMSTVLGQKKRDTYNPGIRTSVVGDETPEVNTGRLKHAVGGQVIADQYGAFQKINLSGTYAIHLPISQKFNLAFGAKVGMTNNTFLQDRAVTLTPGSDATYQTFVANQSNKFNLDIGAGFYLYSQKVFVGVSADQLTGDMVEFGSGTAFFDRQIHMMLTGGVKIPMGTNFELTPAVLVKFMNPAPLAIEGSLQLEYKQRYWFGASYRHQDAVVGMVGMNLNARFKFGYSFDFSINRYNTYKSGGHELVLGIMLGRNRPGANPPDPTPVPAPGSTTPAP